MFGYIMFWLVPKGIVKVDIIYPLVNPLNDGASLRILLKF